MQRKGLELPRCGVLFSPWTDLTLSGRSMRELTDIEVMLRADRLSQAAVQYAGDVAREDPGVSPRFADLQGFPPLLVFVSGSEVLLDDALAVADAAARAGVAVDLRVWPDIFHAWPVATGAMPESDEAVGQASRFIRGHLDRSG
jgi:epsilon-lactone hydrolase